MICHLENGVCIQPQVSCPSDQHPSSNAFQKLLVQRAVVTHPLPSSLYSWLSHEPQLQQGPTELRLTLPLCLLRWRLQRPDWHPTCLRCL